MNIYLITETVLDEKDRFYCIKAENLHDALSIVEGAMVMPNDSIEEKEAVWNNYRKSNELKNCILVGELRYDD